MQFTSLAFIGFFAGVFAVHWAVPARMRRAVCLAASVGFYALFGMPMLAVLALCTVLSYCGGMLLARRHTKPVLFACVAAVLLPLLFYKYFAVLFNGRAPDALVQFSLAVPVGISFFTFKAIAYLAEVYKGMPVCRHFGQYALYLSFFPEVGMGPIQRPADLLRQIETPRAFDTGLAVRGAQLMLWGYFQKLVISDYLLWYISQGLDHADRVIGPSVLIASVLYAFQLYIEFSGYAHISIGCMQLLGFSAPDNFRSPYFSTSVREFWGRWHMTLSSWLRDYVYIPLGGSRCSTARCCANLMITFFISGLWHGTGMQFLVWGLLHGFYLVFGRLTAPARRKLWQLAHISEKSVFAQIVKTCVTFVLVWFGWVFFRAGSVREALYLLSRMTADFSLSVSTLKNALVMLQFNPDVLRNIGIPLVLFFCVDFCARKDGFSAWLSAKKPAFQIVFCYVIAFMVLFLTYAGASPSPAYFQF